MKNSIKTKLVLSSLGFLLLSGQVAAESFPFHGQNDSGLERVQNTPELQAIHDSLLRPITTGHLMRNAAFDGVGSPVTIQNTPELQAIHDSMQRPVHPGHAGANSAFDGKSSWVAPTSDDQLAKELQRLHPGYLAVNSELETDYRVVTDENSVTSNQ